MFGLNRNQSRKRIFKKLKIEHDKIFYLGK